MQSLSSDIRKLHGIDYTDGDITYSNKANYIFNKIYKLECTRIWRNNDEFTYFDEYNRNNNDQFCSQTILRIWKGIISNSYQIRDFSTVKTHDYNIKYICHITSKVSDHQTVVLTVNWLSKIKQKIAVLCRILCWARLSNARIESRMWYYNYTKSIVRRTQE